MAPAEGSDSEGSDGGSKSGSGNKGVIVLDQEDHRIPNEEDSQSDLLWIAREGVTAPVPAPWKACTENGDDIFYFNFETGDSIWDHPSDEHYKKLLQEMPDLDYGEDVKRRKRLEKSAAKIVRTSKTTADTAGGGSLSVSADESFSGSGSLSVSDKVTQGTEVESKPAKGSAQQGEKGSKATSEAKTAKDEAMPSRGLAGVGLAGARLEVPAAAPTPKKEVREAAGSKKGEGSTEEIEEDQLGWLLDPYRNSEEGLDGSASRSGTRGSSKGSGKPKDGRPGEAEMQHRVGSSDASELSEDFMSDMGSPNSSLVPGVRRNSVGGDTLELSVSASASALVGDGEELSAEKAPGANLEAEIASLSRSLATLQRIRESQKKTSRSACRLCSNALAAGRPWSRVKSPNP
eukprot:s89_g11.t1